MALKKLSHFYARASKRKGGDDALEAVLPKRISKQALSRKTDDRCLALMTKSIFISGFRWKVVESKWPEIEAAFSKFAIPKMIAMDGEDIEALMEDRRVIRHRGKLESVRHNAHFIAEVAGEAGSFGKFLSKWPEDDIVGLWAILKKRGSRLGGMTGPRFLREVGKDTFLLTQDVVACLIEAGAIDKEPSSKKDLQKAQDAFNQWQRESGRSLAELSRIVACSTGKNFDVL